MIGELMEGYLFARIVKGVSGWSIAPPRTTFLRRRLRIAIGRLYRPIVNL